ncbi:MAG: hypothetical protein FD130_2122, partial [Halothiobacillaceae bacterium]
DKEVTLTTLSSPAFASIEIHESQQHGDMLHMEQHKELAIAAHHRVVFAPNGLHLMLIDPQRPLRAGESVAVTLQFDQSPAITVSLPVKGADATPAIGNNAHHHPQ